MTIVAITGLRLKSRWRVPQFWWHAVRSMIAARQAPGNLSAEARTIDGVHYTLSVWTDRAAMRAFLVSRPHLQAMRAFPGFATGKTVSFEAATAPDFEAVPDILNRLGREYAARPNESGGARLSSR